MNDERGPWYLLTGLIIGIAFGLIYAWAISPVQYVDTNPSTLRSDFQTAYINVIAAAYVSTGDQFRTQARLSLLENPDIAVNSEGDVFLLDNTAKKVRIFKRR